MASNNIPEAQEIIDEYNAAARDVQQFTRGDKSPAAKAAHKRFEKADKRRWSWR